MGEQVDGKSINHATSAKVLASSTDNLRRQEDSRETGQTEQAVRADHQVDRRWSRNHLCNEE